MAKLTLNGVNFACDDTSYVFERCLIRTAPSGNSGTNWAQLISKSRQSAPEHRRPEFADDSGEQLGSAQFSWSRAMGIFFGRDLVSPP